MVAARTAPNRADFVPKARRQTLRERRRRLQLAEPRVDLVGERTLVVDERAGECSRPLEQRAVGTQPRELQIRQAGLPRPEQLPATPKRKVDLGELEAVGRSHERLQPRLRSVGELL